ncbi:MAG: rRNA maturation RNase YbeY [Pseudomonadota bacterium]
MQRAVAGAPPAAALRRFALAALAARARVALRVVGASESKELNRRYRASDRPTNVLSFPYGGGSGDVVLCHPVIRKEARQQGKSLRAHYAHLVVHGVLHLRGYDHRTGSGAARMERREIRILRRLGFADPYAVK